MFADPERVNHKKLCFEKNNSLLFPAELSVCDENPIEAYIKCLQELIEKIV